MKSLTYTFAFLTLINFFSLSSSVMAQSGVGIAVGIDTAYIDCDLPPTVLDPGVVDFSQPGLSYHYYNGSWSSLPDFGALTPTDSGTVANLDISGRNDNSNYAFVFNGYIYLQQAGNYTFYLRSDDGSQLIIDGLQVVDNDGLHSSRERSGIASLSAGMHAIEVQFFERSGNEVLSWQWAGPGFSKQAIPDSVLYYGDPASLDYSWTGPGGFVDSVMSPTVDQVGMYYLTVGNGVDSVSDSIAVLFDPGPDLSVSGAWLSCGTDSVSLGNALSLTSYEPGITYDYYSGNWTSLPDFSLLTPAKSGTETEFSLAAREADDYFAFVFAGYIQVASSGSYTFYTSSDDGSRLWINDQLIVDNDGLHGTQERSGSLSLSPGYHAIEVHFFERNGGANLTVSYEGPSLSKQEIPDSVLFTLVEMPYTYAWSGPNGFTDTLLQPTVYEEGVYTFSVTDTLSTCVFTDTARVVRNCASYAGRVFHDVNENETYEGNEPTVDSVMVYLVSGSKTVLDSTRTDSAGTFSFPKIGPGMFQFRLAEVPIDLQLKPGFAGMSEKMLAGERVFETDPLSLAAEQSLNVGIPMVPAAIFPVEWLDFQLERQAEGFALYWSTAWEQNNDHFKVQRSLDGKHFSNVGQVEGAGNSFEPTNYYFLDQEENFAGSQTQWHYRLQQVDQTGRTTYSSVLTANLEVENLPLEVLGYPNPVDGDRLYLRYQGGNPGNELTLKVINVLGEILSTRTFVSELSGELSLNISRFPAGTYILLLEDADRKSITRVQKK
jgi:hypothetical protein